MKTDYGVQVKKVKPIAIMVAAGLMPAQVAEPMLSFTATSENVGGAPDSIRIELLRWSSDAERAQLLSAWNMTNGAGQAGRGGRGGRGGAGRAGRGGRGAGDSEEAASPPTPESTLEAALEQAPTVGYLWSSEVAGYALRYAGKVTGTDGQDRIILITERRLGGINDLWKPTGTVVPSTYPFSVIELHVNSKGEGEGKISLTGKVAPDSAAGIVALENYGALPVVLKNLKRRAVEGH
jgi:hypothetical protein